MKEIKKPYSKKDVSFILFYNFLIYENQYGKGFRSIHSSFSLKIMKSVLKLNSQTLLLQRRAGRVVDCGSLENC
jgi:hypothetical protein